MTKLSNTRPVCLNAPCGHLCRELLLRTDGVEELLLSEQGRRESGIPDFRVLGDPETQEYTLNGVCAESGIYYLANVSDLLKVWRPRLSVETRHCSHHATVKTQF